MANIRLLSIDLTGIPEFQSLTKSYAAALRSKNKVAADRIQRYIEQKGSRVLKANLVQGKLGQAQTTDFVLDPASPILQLFSQDVTPSSNIRSVEFKALASAFKGTKIGQITLSTGSSKSYQVEGQEAITGADLASILNTEKEGYIIDIDPYFTDSTGKPKNRSVESVTNRVFNFYMVKEPRLKQLFYSKASTMILNNLYSLNVNGQTVSGVRFVGIQFPISNFTSANFKAVIEKNAIVVSINDSFQKTIFKALDQDYFRYLKQQTGTPYQVTVTNGKSFFNIDMLPPIKGTQLFGTQLTKSIKVYPSDTFFGKYKSIGQRTGRSTQQTSRQQFVSGVQWTVLTQKRLGETMLRMGEPEPPELKERSGRFRGSVQVFANYRTRILQYTYNPLYRSLQKYGYKPDLQVETAIREVAQQLYAQKFNIVRVTGV